MEDVFLNDVVYIRQADLVFPAPREFEELPRQVGAVLHLCLDPPHPLAQRISLFELLQDQRGIAWMPMSRC
jgi:hypothetical protein